MSGYGNVSSRVARTVLPLSTLVVLVVGGIPAMAAKRIPYQVVYAFTGGADGGMPEASLIKDSSGDVYGTTYFGGTCGGNNGCGTVFQVKPSGTETVLHSFNGWPADGFFPGVGNLTRDSAGNLYGTTEEGGAYDFGTVFKVAPNGTETLLYSFCPGGYPCADGYGPAASVAEDGKGNLFGTALVGGSSGDGTIYEITSSGTYKVLYNFTGGADGGEPFADLLRVGGNFYGTASSGGADGYGTVFELVKGEKGAYAFKVLYTFTGGTDGGSPYADLMADKSGNLCSTASGGGTSGNGVVFELAPDGTETVLYSFRGGNDGAFPTSGLVLRKGTFYGTTYSGGTGGSGTVFSLAADGTETVLHSFTGGTDGENPYGAGPLVASGGYFYGTTGGGTTDWGTVFKVKY